MYRYGVTSHCAPQIYTIIICQLKVKNKFKKHPHGAYIPRGHVCRRAAEGSLKKGCAATSIYPESPPWRPDPPSQPSSAHWEANPWTPLSLGRTRGLQYFCPTPALVQKDFSSSGCITPGPQFLPGSSSAWSQPPLRSTRAILSPCPHSRRGGHCFPLLLVCAYLTCLICSHNPVHTCKIHPINKVSSLEPPAVFFFPSRTLSMQSTGLAFQGSKQGGAGQT